MASKYQWRHYEDVASILSGHGTYTGRLSDLRAALVDDFADLFAADNPACCAHCGDEKGTTSICTRPNEGHVFLGFDRERFLKACGLEADPWNEVVDGLADAITGLKS